jgi:hypothetical protein
MSNIAAFFGNTPIAQLLREASQLPEDWRPLKKDTMDALAELVMNHMTTKDGVEKDVHNTNSHSIVLYSKTYQPDEAIKNPCLPC